MAPTTSTTTIRALIAGTDLDAIDAHLAALVARPAWQLSAACRYEDPRLFFPEVGGSAHPAKAICARCPVVGECDEFARPSAATDTLGPASIAGGAVDGIWAGTTAKERRAAQAPQRRRYRPDLDDAVALFVTATPTLSWRQRLERWNATRSPGDQFGSHTAMLAAWNRYRRRSPAA